MENNKIKLAYIAFISGLMLFSMPVQANEWSDLYNNLSANGFAIIIKANNLKVNNVIISDGATIKGNNSLTTINPALIKFADNSILWLGANTKVDLFTTAKTGALISLIQGQIMAYIQTKKQYFYPLLIHTDNSDYGLRSGYFYHQILNEPNTIITDSTDAANINLADTNTEPLEISSLKDGIIDILQPDLTRVLQTITYFDSRPFYLIAKGTYQAVNSDLLINQIAENFQLFKIFIMETNLSN